MCSVGSGPVRSLVCRSVYFGQNQTLMNPWSGFRSADRPDTDILQRQTQLKQVTQNIKSGKLDIADLPEPMASPGELVIANAASLISAGTEKMVMGLAKKSLIGKARSRPDHARRVIQKMKTEGFFETIRQVRAKLGEPIPMGYSSAGVVVACGDGVQGYQVGDRVASNGPHAGVVAVPVNLCARIPDSVSYDHASFAVVGSIALQGVRLSKVTLGESVMVIGLGLVGQMTVMVLKAAGCRVLATDLDPGKCELALKLGADIAKPGLSASQVESLTGGVGADAVIITAATESNAPIELSADAVRRRGRVVLVGVVGLDIPRTPFYMKEAEFTVSCSYGPGRYDADYEQRGHDYPPGYVRWTEQRNIQAVLHMIAADQLNVEALISHRFTIDNATQAYDMVYGNTEPYLGIVLQYPETDPQEPARSISMSAAGKAKGDVGIGVVGAGNFARMTMVPAIQSCAGVAMRSICSHRGVTAKSLAEQFGFATVATDSGALLADDSVDAVFLLTRHDQHADQVLAAVKAGKHVFVEKPLAITGEQVLAIEAALAEKGDQAPLLMVGFNRRFSQAAVKVRAFFEKVEAPITVAFRFNAGEIPADSWVQHQTEGGGRIIGEACHAIDLATYLTGSEPVRVYAECIGGPNAPAITDDQSFITVRHANGSISSIAYLAGGDKAMPKERIEILGGGKMAIIDDFREVQLSSGGKLEKHKLTGKGHAEEVQAFVKAVKQGGAAPISWSELRSVSLASILAVRSLREGVPFVVPSAGLIDGDEVQG